MSEKWKIGKEFHFEFGHSVWNQSLNPEYSVDNNNCCRALHGHSGRVVVELQASELKGGMVTDFCHLGWFKKFIDDVLDHKMIIDFNDPGISHIVPNWNQTDRGEPAGIMTLLQTQPQGHMIVDPNYFKTLVDERLIELLNGFVFVSFVPTSENLSKWLHSIVESKMSKIGVHCTQIQFFETSKSQCNYLPES